MATASQPSMVESPSAPSAATAIAMAAAIAGLAADGPVHIERFDAVATSYPGFEEDLLQCVS